MENSRTIFWNVPERFPEFPTDRVYKGQAGGPVSQSLILWASYCHCLYQLAGIFGRYSQVLLYHLRSYLHWILGLYFNYIVDYTRLYWTIHWTTHHHLESIDILFVTCLPPGRTYPKCYIVGPWILQYSGTYQKLQD